MVKTNLKITKGTKIILISSIIAVLCLLLTPLFFIDNLSSGIVTIWGFKAILGIGSFTYGNNLTQFETNWYLFIACLVFLIMGFTTYYIGPKSKGYYIFSVIIFAILAIVCFNSKNWFVVAQKVQNNNKLMNGTYLGIGPWVSGLVCCINAIIGIVEYRTFKLR